MKSKIYLTSFLLLLITVAQLKGQGGYVIQSHDVIVEISNTGKFEVTESLKVNFTEQRRGIIRSIPLRYELGDRKKTIRVTDLQEQNGYNYKAYTESGNRVIRIGSADKYITGIHDYRINYVVSGAIVNYDNHDEFYWNLVDFDTGANVLESSFEIRFPENWTEQITEYRAFSGPKGSQAHDIEMEINGSILKGKNLRPLPPDHGVTLAINFPKGLFPSSMNTVRPKASHEPLNWIINWWNALPILAASLLFGFWRRFEKSDTQVENSATSYYPPEDMSSAETGAFIDYKVNRRDLISLLPFWGNKGYVKIQPLDGSENDMYFKKIEHPRDLPRAEQILFDGLFEKGDVILLSDLTNEFYSTMSKATKALHRDVIKQKLYDEKSLKYMHSGWLIFLGIIGIMLGIALIVGLGALAAGIGMILIGIFTFIFHFKRPKFSEKGIRYHSQLKGLKSFLKNPDENAMSEILSKDPQYLNTIYPYVLAFGIDDSWTKAIQSFEVKYPPIWYDHSSIGRPFTYQNIGNSFSARTIEQVFYSTPNPPPSSSGGGFSGGSAGGGFGGGSTSSW